MCLWLRGEIDHRNQTSFSGRNKIQSFGVGVSLKIVPIQFKVEYTHNWKKSMKNTKETKVSFVLGDENPGDEFVVDVFYDTKYGSVVFDTIAGRSKCPWEAGTLH